MEPWKLFGLIISSYFLTVEIISTNAWSPASNLLLSGSKSYMVYSDSITAGVARAMRECRRNFYWDRWNCPEDVLTLFNKQSPTREISFVHAISSAGVMYSLTKNCSEGAYDRCGCDDSKREQPTEGWMWGGCSDNVKFGEKISKQFVDALEDAEDAQALMNLHNNEVGRKTVRQKLEKRCKCHGVSGSCSLQTCWLQLSDFKEIAGHLRKKYFSAIQVDFVRGRLIESNSATTDDHFPSMRRDLVYLEASPNYCYANATVGFSGTVGRECLRQSRNREGEKTSQWERDSCNRLCRSCGLNVRKTREVESRNCNCKFMWCCSVKCDQCKKKVTKYTCNKE